ncbi:DUF4202 domain-containing protein [Tenacibaculum jejuense]|uniref:DUF4202 domain-containing protein n=1 Tax=Tenacibaculum jejuense TaxID=584609 RepID=A0A238UBC7_9FLAO|nr:DUF4202 domain-containing protein [Tenacibaculum jejuense]SNR16276.1 Protein of unknown function [Tenacibaculum jejuense]
MKPTRFETALALIDKKNAEDPNLYTVNNMNFPKELLYSQRMSRQLLQFNPNASRALQIAARAQHICRWKIPRSEYPMDRIGYLKWREELKRSHATITAEILAEVGYNDDFIKRVRFLILKKQLKKNEEAQTLEDVICLVFLDFYFEEFAAKHNDEKVIDILQKTLVKMSDKGKEEALKIKFSDKSLALVQKAIH